MPKHHRLTPIHYWYWLIALGLLTVLAWFFIEITSPKNAEEVAQKAQARLLPPLLSEFNNQAVSFLKTRLEISEIELQQTAPYTKKQGTAIPEEMPVQAELGNFNVEEKSEMPIPTSTPNLLNLNKEASPAGNVRLIGN